MNIITVLSLQRGLLHTLHSEVNTSHKTSRSHMLTHSLMHQSRISAATYMGIFTKLAVANKVIKVAMGCEGEEVMTTKPIATKVFAVAVLCSGILYLHNFIVTLVLPYTFVDCVIDSVISLSVASSCGCCGATR